MTKNTHSDTKHAIQALLNKRPQKMGNTTINVAPLPAKDASSPYYDSIESLIEEKKESFVSRFTDSKGHEFGATTYLDSGENTKEYQEIVKKRIHHKMNAVFGSSLFRDRHLKITESISGSLYDSYQRLLEDPCIALHGRISAEEAAKVSTVFSEVLQRNVVVEKTDFNGHMYYRLRNISLMDVLKLDGIQETRARKIAETVIGETLFRSTEPETKQAR